jgi:hypothetical protein
VAFFLKKPTGGGVLQKYVFSFGYEILAREAARPHPTSTKRGGEDEMTSVLEVKDSRSQRGAKRRTDRQHKRKDRGGAKAGELTPATPQPPAVAAQPDRGLPRDDDESDDD